MNSEKLVKILDRLLEYFFYLLFFLVPLVMTPWNFELFEYNKMMLTYALTAVIVGVWLAKMVISRQVIFRRTPLDIPLLIFLISQSLSFLFSIDRHTSFWGYYSRFHGGLLSTISYILLYYAFVSNFDKQKTLTAIRYTLYAAALVAAYGIAEHFGIDAQYWVQDVKSRVFSTLGQPNWLAAYLAALLPLPLAFTLSHRKKWSLLLFYSSTLLLFLLCVFFTKSRSGIPAAALGLLFFTFLLFLPKILSLKKILLGLSVSALLFLLIGGLFWGLSLFPSSLQDTRYILGLTENVQIRIHFPYNPGSPSGDIRKVVWRGAMDIAKAYPLFGSGVETFAYSYYQFRPQEHNLLSEWDFLYNKAHNEYFNFLATTGVVGLGSYLLLIGWIVWWNLKVRRDTKHATRNNQHSLTPNPYPLITTALFAGWATILITNFFGFSVVPVALFFFLFPTFAVILASEDSPSPTPPKKTSMTNYPARLRQDEVLVGGQLLITIFILFTIFYLLFTIMNYWRADVAFAQGNRLNRQGEYALAFQSLREAIKLNSGEPVYRDELAWTAANLAVYLYLQKDSANASTMINLALSSSDQAQAISRRNLNFYRTRAKVFYKLAVIDQKYLQGAYQTLLEAKKLAPTEAKILYNLALIQETLGQREEAIKTLAETIKIKRNYADAYYALALLYKEEGRTPEAIQTLENLLKDTGGLPEAGVKLKEWQGK